MNYNLDDFLKRISDICNYTILDTYKKKIYILVDSKKKISNFFKIKNNIIHLSDCDVYIILAGQGFLDPIWEKNILERKEIDCNEKCMLFIYDSYCHNNIFKYYNKLHISRLLKNDRLYTTQQLINMLIEYLDKNNYSLYYCSLKNVSINEQLISKYNYVRTIHKFSILKKYIVIKIPGLISKLYYFYKKVLNVSIFKFRKLYKKLKRENYVMYNLNKKSIKYGCMYYRIYNSKNNFFLKAYDCFNTSKNEMLAFNIMKEKDFVLNIYDSDGKKYVISEYCTGITLEEYLKNNSINQKFINQFIKQFIIILDELNHFGIIHRDIKADNIVLYFDDSDNFKVKVIDFGFSVFDKKDYLNYKKILERKILRSLGETYKPNLYMWDDSVSLINMLENIYDDIYSDCWNMANKVIKLNGRNVIANGKSEKEDCVFDFTL